MKPENIEAALLLQNNTPLDDFCGLTSNEVHHLLYDTFGSKSPLRISPEIDDATLDQIPFLRLTEEFLKIIQREGHVKLTPLGALQRKVIRELYGHGFIPEQIVELGISKLSSEADSPAITSMHFNTQIAALVRKANNKLKLTTRGQKLLGSNRRIELFRQILATYTGRFNWASNDGFGDVPIGQLGWGYTAYLLHKFGGSEQFVKFYADKYLLAFPALLRQLPWENYSTPEKRFMDCYKVRAFERFLMWFGLVQDDPNGDKVKPTPVFSRVFLFG